MPLIQSIKHRVTEGMKAAMRAKDAPRLSAIRLLLAAIRQREIDERIELSDPDILVVVEKMLKQRRDSIAQFEAAARQDLADVEKFEISVLQSYLPEPLSDDEIAAEVSDAFAKTEAKTMQDMGKVIAILKPKLAGRADLGRVSAIVRARLTA